MGKRLTCGEPIDKRRIGLSSVLEQVAGGFAGREIIGERLIAVVNRSIDIKGLRQHLLEGVVENAYAAAQNAVMRNSKRLPGKAEARRPKNSVGLLECVFLICKDHLVVRLVGIMADFLEGSGRDRKTALIAPKICTIFGAECER